MKIEINLDEITVNDWSDTISSMIQDELMSSVRQSVRAAIKKEHKTIEAAVNKALGTLNRDQITALAIQALKSGAMKSSDGKHDPKNCPEGFRGCQGCR